MHLIVILVIVVTIIVVMFHFIVSLEDDRWKYERIDKDRQKIKEQEENTYTSEKQWNKM